MKAIKILIYIIITIPITNISAQNGTIKGKITDALNNEPLPFVNVVVEGTSIGATTDIEGNYVITGLEPGYVRIQASFVGYETAISSEILVSNANQAFVDIEMIQLENKLEEVTVKASPFIRTEESPVSLRNISLSEIENNPGANRDISKVIQSFPGVASSVSFRNDIIIRGGGPSESRFFLDGIEVPNINHFATQGASGGPVGILNADFIREVNYFSGAFPANRGNALSGIFEFKQVDGNKDKLKFRGSVGASEIAGTLDGPIGEKTSFIFSARQSYLQFLFDALGLPFLPTFNDFQFKLRTRIDAKNELTLIGLGAIDLFKLNTSLKDQTDEQQYILSYLPVYEQWNYTVGAVYKHFFKKSYHSFIVSRSHLNNTAYKYFENDDSSESNKIYDYNSQEIENKLRYENTSRIHGMKLIYGAKLDLATYTNNTFQKRVADNDIFQLDYNTRLQLVKYGLFSQVSKDFLQSRLTLSGGIRFDGNSFAPSMSNPFEQFSPRISASYFISEKLTVNANTGKYYQLPPYTSLGFKLNDVFVNKENKLKYISVNHYIAGLEYRLNNHTQFVLEGFYKQYGHYPFSVNDSMSIANKGADFGVIGDEEVVSTSKGRAYGFELMGRVLSPKGFNVNMSYTYVRSEFKDKNDTYAPSSWDNRHILTLTSTYNFKNNWKAGLKWRFLGGPPYTPYDIEKSERIEAWDTQGRAFFNMNKLNSERLGVFHQLDIRIDKAWYFNKWSLMLYFDIQNAYNYKYNAQDNLIRAKDNKGNYILKDNNTRYTLKSLENTTGTVLPTIGIIVEI